VDAGDDDVRLRRARLLLEPSAARPDPALLRMEILSAYPLAHAYEAGRAEREQQLDAAVQAVDVTALDRGDQAAFDTSLRAAQTKLEALRPWLQQFTIRATGNSHIDMAWLWPWTETVEVVRSTFRSALDLMREYPDFTFSMGSAQTFAWMEEKYPDMFREIQQRVKEGRWELVAACGGAGSEHARGRVSGAPASGGQALFPTEVRRGREDRLNPDSFGYSCSSRRSTKDPASTIS